MAVAISVLITVCVNRVIFLSKPKPKKGSPEGSIVQLRDALAENDSGSKYLRVVLSDL
jgi:hypothetical protein